MKRYTKNEKGIALVMVLILALVGLAIVSAVMFMLTQGTTMSGAYKFYKTAEEASFGGTELAASYISNGGLLNLPLIPGLAFTGDCSCGDPYNDDDNLDNMLAPPSRTDRCDKLCSPTNKWPLTLDESPTESGVQVGLKATDNPDLQFILGGAQTTYEVFVKIVDTVRGNTERYGIITTGGELGGYGVAYQDAYQIMPQTDPWLYRLEVEARSITNPTREKARLSVLYAF